jgi:hypothetical protein
VTATGDLLAGVTDGNISVGDGKLGSKNADTIADFKHNTDIIALDDALFTAIGIGLDKGEFYARAAPARRTTPTTTSSTINPTAGFITTPTARTALRHSTSPRSAPTPVSIVAILPLFDRDQPSHGGEIL